MTEFSIIVPILLLLIFVLPQFALWFHARQVAARAAQQGVDAGRAYNAVPGDGADAATAFLNEMGGSLQSPQVSVDTSGPGEMAVTVRGSVTTLIPGIHLTVVHRAEAPIEDWTP
ncbi:TadE/TadG family type IV pilus assembly protein [Streptomyces violaceusniger]|uniref:TadE/TadG family type IV pilus assembly protein n=1 Tax=Streptomyces violaceusniger TaxID=68280 RepID=UPI003432A709